MNLCLRILFIFAPIHISSESASMKTFCNKPADSGIMLFIKLLKNILNNFVYLRLVQDIIVLAD